MSTLRNWAVIPVDVFRILSGWREYRRSGQTPNSAYQSLIRLFCTTKGYSNDILSGLISLMRPPCKLPPLKGVLGEMSPQRLDAVLGDIRSKGFHVFDTKLPDDVCDRLLHYCTTSESSVRAMDGADVASTRRMVYDRRQPQGARYDFECADILANPDVQAILADVTLVAVAQAYLKCRPTLDVLGLWWHTAFSKQPDKHAAQFYHFDMDRIKWIKFFIYLTDVTTETGPHTFVEGTHLTGSIPTRLLSQGYSRLTDDDVEGCYPRERFIEFNAPRGTIIAEDTRGLHKGKHVSRGDRLIMSIQFSNSLFGARYEKSQFGRIADPGLDRMVQEFREIYAHYLPMNEAA